MATTVIDQLVTILGFKGDTKDLDKINQKIKNVQGSINKVAKGFAIAGAALTGVGVAVVKASLSYEEAINNLRVYTDLTEKSIDLLKRQARELGKGGRFGAEDVIAGQTQLLRGQFDVQEAIEAMPDVVRLATAAMIPLDQAASAVDATLRQFNLKATDTEHVVNLIGQTMKNARAPIKNLVPAMGTVSTFAEAMGLSLEDSLTMVVAFGEQVGTERGFRTAASDLETLSRKFLQLAPDGEEILQRLTGLDASQVKKMVQEGQLVEVFRRLQGASLEDLEVIFTESAFDASKFITPEMLARLDELGASYVNVAGTIKEMADERDRGLPGAWADFTSALTDVRIALGESGIIQAAEWLLKKLRDLLWVISSAPGPVKAFAGAVIISGPILLGAAAAAKVLAWSLDSSLVRAIGRLARAIYTTFVPSLVRAKIAMLLTSPAARAMWAAITGPIGLAILAFAAVGALIYKFRRQILGALKSVWSWIKGNWPLLVGILLGPFGIVGALVWKFRRQILGALQTVWKWVKGNWPLLLGILLGPFGIAGAMIWKFRDQILGAFQDVWDWLRESPIFGPVIDGIQAIIDFVSELPGRVVGILKDIPGMVADAIRDIPGLGGAIKVFTGLSDKVGGFFGKVKENFDKGGIVPGPTGRPMLATVHGGEMIIPPSAGQMLLDMFQGFKLGAAGLPTPPPGAGTMYRQSINNRPTVNFSGDITININTSPGADSGEIAEDVAQNIADAVDKAIGKTFRDIAHDFDGPIER